MTKGSGRMLEQLKRKVIEIAKRAEAEGLCRHKSGNFSLRDRDTGRVAVTPSGVAREDLTEDAICVVDLEANVLEAGDGVRPTSELLMHLKVYQTRPDLFAVAHTHSKFATAFSVLNKEIPPIVYEAVNIVGSGGRIRVAPYARPGTEALAASVIAPMREGEVCLLANHGALAAAENLDEALLKAAYVEEIAEVYYRAIMLNGGKEPEAIPRDELGLWKYPNEIKMNR